MSHGRHRRPGVPKRALAAGTSVASGAAVSGVVLSGHAAIAAPLPSSQIAVAEVHAVTVPALAPGAGEYTVKPGDYLSLIASRKCGSAADWTGIYHASRQVIGNNPDLIFAGQRLTLDCSAQPVAYIPAEHALPASRRVKRVVITRSEGGSIVADVQMVFGSGAGCAEEILNHESGLSWSDVTISNPSSGAYGLPQALPGDKMASAGPDWATNPVTQLRWMQGYVDSAYGGVCNAAWHDVNIGWY